MSNVSIKAEWRKVTKASELHVGQRIRYSHNTLGKFGYEYCSTIGDDYRKVESIVDNVVNTCDKQDVRCSNNIFSVWQVVEALFEIKTSEKGVWKAIISSSQLHVGQPIRYLYKTFSAGFDDANQAAIDRYREVVSIDDDGRVNTGFNGNIMYRDLFSKSWEVVEAFFPVKEKQEDIVFVMLITDYISNWRFRLYSMMSEPYSSKQEAINAVEDILKNKLGFKGEIYYN